MIKKNTNTMVGGNTAKMLKAVQQQRLQSRARSALKQVKPPNDRRMLRLPSIGHQTAAHTARSTAKLNTNVILMKPMSAQRPTTIANIDLTGSKDPVVSSGYISGTTKSLRPTSQIFPKASNMMTINKVPSKNMSVGPLASTHKPVSSSIELVSSSDNALIPIQSQSEIITVSDEIDCSNDDIQTEEMNYIVDEAGNLIAESDDSCSTSKKEDILAKALQDTDVLPTEITLSSSSTILLEPCKMQNTSSSTIYENVTLNTPPIMSSFETPSRTVNEISEYIIISHSDNIQ